MSNDSSAIPDGAVQRDPLTPMDRRLLGVLIEKQKTSKSADAYPMTVNSIMVGANQKSNRDPVVNLDDDEVEDGLGLLQRRGLVSKITGGRVDRWRHLCYESWTVNKIEMAILAELLLRGPQTEGDLRARASRMSEIRDVDELKTLLKPLVDRKLVVYLLPPDRRGTVLTHGFHTEAEFNDARVRAGSGNTSETDSPAPRSFSSPSINNSALEDQLKSALEKITSLEATVGTLSLAVDEIRKQLGMSE